MLVPVDDKQTQRKKQSNFFRGLSELYRLVFTAIGMAGTIPSESVLRVTVLIVSA